MTSKPITHVATTDIREMMNPGSERRMDLPGFDPEFVDFPHYIIRITERIWHDRDVDLCLAYYAEDCAIHTMSGPLVGAKTVRDNTLQTLEAFPDRRLDGDNVIWSSDGRGTFHSSHLITSKMTNLGTTEFGPPTGRRVQVQTIADCLCKENKVIEEWLVRDHGSICVQLGFDLEQSAIQLAEKDKQDGCSLIDALSSARETVGSFDVTPKGEASTVAAKALRASWDPKALDHCPEFYDFRARVQYPTGRSSYGHDQYNDIMKQFVGAFPKVNLSINHVAETPYLGDAVDVALRWSIRTAHDGHGAYGRATGAPIYILGVSHYRVMNGRIREETTIWDDVALHRQIATARLS
ncbi:MAG: ester cyclase [Pseudomonadota bacterium]